MTKLEKANLSADDRLFNKNKWLFATGGLGRDMMYGLVASYLLIYIQFGLQLTLVQFATISLIIGVLARIWDGINDPIIGAIIEGSNLKHGKYKPWIFVGAVVCGLMTVALFTIRPQGWWFVAYISVAYLVWETFFTMNDIGYYSMLPSLSSKDTQRNSITHLTVFFAGLGGAIISGIIALFTPGKLLDNYVIYAVIAAAAVILCQSMTAFGVKEKPQKERRPKVTFKKLWHTLAHNDQLLWMSLALIFYNLSASLLTSLAYNLYYLEVGYDGSIFIFFVIFMVGNLGIQIFYPAISKKLGRRKLQAVTAAFMAFGYLGIAMIGWWGWLPFNLVTLSLFGIPVFTGQALFYISMMINSNNCVEYNEYKTGNREEAIVSTMRPLIVKFADALKYVIITVVLTASGIYFLTQNIAALENQVSFFNASTETEQIVYVDTLQGYFTEIDGLDTDSPEYETIIDRIQSELDNDPIMEKFRIDATRLHVLEDTRIYENGVEIGLLSEIDPNAMDSDNVYTLVIIGEDTDGTPFNLGNENLRDNMNLAGRIALRMVATVLPAAFIIISMLIQKKKFVIDEKFYNEMVSEIEKRKKVDAISGE